MLKAMILGQLRGFIRAIDNYRLIPTFKRLATPLIALTQKYARFKWTEDCQRAFDSLEEQLTAIPSLTNPELSKPMLLYTLVINISVQSLLGHA